MAANLIKLQCRNVSWTSPNLEGGAIIMKDTISRVCQQPESNSGTAMDAAKVGILMQGTLERMKNH